MKRYWRNYTVGLIAGYDYLKEQASYNPGYVYGQVSTALAVTFKLHLIGILAATFSFTMNRINAWSVEGIAALILITAILVISFGKASKFLSGERYQCFIEIKNRLSEHILKRLRIMSMMVFIVNVFIFIFEVLITVWVGNS